MRAIVVADGDIRPGPALSSALVGADLVVAADGGAVKAESLGLRPDVVVGDGDSLPAERAAALRAGGAEVIVHPVDKDESDTELALREAVMRGATSIVVIGAFGGPRPEHSIANLFLLALPALEGREVTIVDGASTVRLLSAGGALISGSAGDFVSLVPLSERVDGVTTDGLRFALADATLHQGPTLGLSNELATDHAEVRVGSGRLALIHTQRTGG